MSGRKKRRITKEHRVAERSKFPNDRSQMKVSELSAWTDFFGVLNQPRLARLQN